MRSILPFGFKLNGSQGKLKGKSCTIITTLVHTENRRNMVCYFCKDDYYPKCIYEDEFIENADNKLKAALKKFEPFTVDDDAMDSNYRHFKGKWYRLICVANDNEEDAICIYKPLYGDLTLTYGRPKKMFFSETDKNAYPGAKQEWRMMNYHEICNELGKEETQKIIQKECREFLEGLKCKK